MALLSGILCDTVGNGEIQHAMMVDTERRQYRKPVVADYKWFPSVADAVRYEMGKEVYQCASTVLRRYDALRKRITVMCDNDDVPGYYWSE